MSELLSEIRRLNGLGNRAIAEPFGGGAGASLSLLYLEAAPEIYVNDADPSIYDFWWALTRQSKAFLELLAETPVNIKEWSAQRDIYRSPRRTSRFRRGFAAFYLNRCNRSGIIRNGGAIGGLGQSGKWKIGARFNKAELHRRCEKVAAYRDRIHISGKDGIKLIEELDESSTFFFIDPPYFVKGKTLYLNALDEPYHQDLSNSLRKKSGAAWVLTYDDCPKIRQMYRDWAQIRPFRLRYSAADRKSGKEIMIVPRWMKLPSWQRSASIKW